MAKRVVIVHCWSGYPGYCWYPQVKKDLEAKDFSVQVPTMPETDTPKLALWLPKLQEVIGTPDKDLCLVGHSVGCITILRYLENLGENQKVGGVVLVAGFTEALNTEGLRNFFTTPIDFDKIKSHCDKFVAIHSDDDPHVDLRYGDEFKNKLGAKLIVKHGMKHFSGPVDNEDSCTSLPDVTEAILKF